jgi:hypothetical protein
MKTTPQKITTSYLAICEGEADKSFLSSLVKTIPINNVEFVCPIKTEDADVEDGWGKDYFFASLDAQELTSNYDNLKGIVIIQDSDESSAEAFKQMCEQIRKYNRKKPAAEKFGIPSDLLKPVFTAKKPALLFLTIPWIDKKGALESLILPSLEAKYPQIAECLENYINCTENAKRWSITKQSKMKLSCLVSTICKKDPTCAIQNMLTKTEFRGLLEHESFDEIKGFFTDLDKYFEVK